MQRSAEVATASISSHSFLIQEHFLASTRMRRLSLLPPGISAKIPVSFLSKGISVISPPLSRPPIKIGRASCRERVKSTEVAGARKNKRRGGEGDGEMRRRAEDDTATSTW